MRPEDVVKAAAKLERREELLEYLSKIKAAETIKVEIEPTFILQLTTKSTQDFIDRICRQYIDELNGIEKDLETLGVMPE